MLAQWTADLVGKMHKHKVSKTMLAKEIGLRREYVSLILNGHREPAGAQDRFMAALDRLIQRQQTEGSV